MATLRRDERTSLRSGNGEKTRRSTRMKNGAAPKDRSIVCRNESEPSSSIGRCPYRPAYRRRSIRVRRCRGSGCQSRTDSSPDRCSRWNRRSPCRCPANPDRSYRPRSKRDRYRSCHPLRWCRHNHHWCILHRRNRWSRSPYHPACRRQCSRVHHRKRSGCRRCKRILRRCMAGCIRPRSYRCRGHRALSHHNKRDHRRRRPGRRHYKRIPRRCRPVPRSVAARQSRSVRQAWRQGRWFDSSGRRPGHPCDRWSRSRPAVRNRTDSAFR